ncbi:MAG: HU family DNA-binding protein [Rhodoblastus sp.]|nr:HU family DNA-binding protein [Rhodoblastus sp.]
MNKTELVSALAEAHELSKPQIGRLVDDVFGNIEAALKKGDEVRFVNFGSFSVKERAARKARNPATGEEIEVPATRKVVFRPGKELKERVGG